MRVGCPHHDAVVARELAVDEPRRAAARQVWFLPGRVAESIPDRSKPRLDRQCRGLEIVHSRPGRAVGGGQVLSALIRTGVIGRRNGLR